MKRLTTRKEYDETKLQVEQLIADATRKGMLEPDMVNDYTLKISELCKQMADYEDNVMKLFPLNQKPSVVPEDYHYVIVNRKTAQQQKEVVLAQDNDYY